MSDQAGFVVVARTQDGLSSRSEIFETEDDARWHANKLAECDAMIHIETIGPTGMLCQPTPWPLR